MLLVPKVNRFAFTYDNWGANFGTSAGTSVVPGASNVYGSWTEVISDANVTTDIWAIEISITGGNTANSDKSQLVDIGYDPAGGTTYVSIFGDTATVGQAATKAWVCGNVGTLGTTGPDMVANLPLRIPSGSAIAVRLQGSNATAGTVRVLVKLYGKPSAPDITPRGGIARIIGAVTTSGGVSFTPGNATDGAWTSLGATGSNLWWWQLGVQCSNGTQTALYYYFDLAYGDGSNYHLIHRQARFTNTSETSRLGTSSHYSEAFCHVPSGATLYVRGRCSAAPTSGWNANVIGIG